ncbi:hypothetical protein ACIBEJ_13875 [Nonomuraea sp. NPDC050790]|uniref:hypothetical protein n=1 Tax=Nonomuraea sp. NPDC050790 TaxID=3364371 RepID=UPI0037B6B34B
MKIATRPIAVAACALGCAALLSIPATAAQAAETCRYTVSADKSVPVKSGPGKGYTTQGKVSASRTRPLFGTCDTTWVKISQGKFAGGWIWSGYLDRM